MAKITENHKETIQSMIANASGLEFELVWIPKIMARQTDDEQMAHETKEKNSVGLNGRDALFITSLYDRIQDNQHLTPKMVECVRRILPKYWKQFESIMIWANKGDEAFVSGSE